MGLDNKNTQGLSFQINAYLFHIKSFLLTVGINQNTRTKSGRSNIRDLRGMVWKYSVLAALLQLYGAENVLNHLPQAEVSIICCCPFH